MDTSFETRHISRPNRKNYRSMSRLTRLNRATINTTGKKRDILFFAKGRFWFYNLYALFPVKRTKHRSNQLPSASTAVVGKMGDRKYEVKKKATGLCVRTQSAKPVPRARVFCTPRSRYANPRATKWGGKSAGGFFSNGKSFQETKRLH